jgi:minor curlin subunit
MKRLSPLLLCLALGGQAWADDLMDNADLAAGNDLGEPLVLRLLPSAAGQLAVIEQQGNGNRAALDQNGVALLGQIVQAGARRRRTSCSKAAT